MMAGECYLTSIRLTVIVFAMLVSLTLGFFGQKPRVKGERIIFVEVEADDTARLKPTLRSFKKKWKVFWYKNNTLIRNRKNSKKYRFKNHLLRIKHVSKDDAGLYKCVIKNKFGNASQLFNLTVGGEPPGIKGQGPPWFPKSPPKEQFIAWPASNDLKLRCPADGERPLRYQWYKDGKPLQHRRLDASFNSTRWYLRIKMSVLSDNGLYTCLVTNKLGNASRKFKVQILEKAQVAPILSDQYPKNYTKKIGSNVTFQCIELVSPILTDYRWLFWKGGSYPNLQMLKDLSSYNSTYFKMISPLQYQSFKVKNAAGKYGGRVLLTNVTKKDQGWYTCLISNNLGRGWRTAHLTVLTEKEWDDKFVVKRNPTTAPAKRSNSNAIGESSIIAISVLAVCILITFISVSIGIVFYKRKLSKKVVEKVLYSRGFDLSKESSSVFVGQQDSVKVFGLKRNGRLESSSSTSSTMPLMHRQNSYRTRLPSNIDADLNEGEFELPYDEEWEIEECQLAIKDEILGEGAFGLVMKADAFDLPGHPKCHTVAVKMLKNDATEVELADLVSEMETMKRIGSHKNIINFLGCCTQNGACFLYMVVEYAPYGNLREFLRNRRPAVLNARLPCDPNSNLAPVTTRDFISFAFQISRGMEHLVARKCIHRDLAARNILVGEDYVMKIADFGLARHTRMDYYRKTTDGRLPVKWLAIEALFDRVYTIQSDVWAFGILLWEIFTLGGSPYPGIPVEKLFELLNNGYRMEKPENCPYQIYEMMLKTWSENPSHRPSFAQLERELEKMLSSLTNQEYLDILPANTSRKEVESLSSDSGCSVIESNEEQKPSAKDASV
ncbi:fibroblast growth factor receptor 2-like [Xenia sp. Carnegie-2017]|uniref:fibroblast growth factor receptor 2-like n=1 Tax=Xenia sp. Carnegie-2017 TaxID=2897299 RepID=UPI001F039920|nr:fibroblast growth factor receptor 2-like [Xenia sp. Carnegie-2017]XP_046851374.1 fibroblast growth factor receptor 2-like [Xenia sp. Carnegie-2017]XP_046851375.1 fibroblast growth factor receptor 2-like [Xenia sp. Carnegie-2017]